MSGFVFARRWRVSRFHVTREMAEPNRHAICTHKHATFKLYILQYPKLPSIGRLYSDVGSKFQLLEGEGGRTIRLAGGSTVTTAQVSIPNQRYKFQYQPNDGVRPLKNNQGHIYSIWYLPILVSGLVHYGPIKILPVRSHYPKPMCYLIWIFKDSRTMI